MLELITIQRFSISSMELKVWCFRDADYIMKDFDCCVNLYKDFITQSKSHGCEPHIAAVITPEHSHNSLPEKNKKGTPKDIGS
jgi:hypothetical protein